MRLGYFDLNKSSPRSDHNMAFPLNSQFELTDVVMPQMSGKELVQNLSEIIPNIKILYVSGYTENTIVHHGILEEEVDFLPKPYTISSLAKKVREVLDKE